MADHANIATSEIEGLLRRSPFKLVFPPKIESAFDTASAASRRMESTVAAFIGLVIYDFLFYADYLLLRDVLSSTAMIRFAIVTPLGLAVIWLSARTRSLQRRETYQSIITVIVAASLTAMELQSEAAGRSYHHFGFVEVIVYAAIVQRLRFRYAVGTVATIVGLHLLTVLQMHEIDLQMRLAANSLVLGAAIFILVASYTGERWERHSFLMRTLDTQRLAELDRLARIDALTGLANRGSLDAYLARDFDGEVGVLLLDVDAFKRYNDCYGHQAGDRCLNRVAQAVQAAANNASLVARYGGEELIVLMERADLTAVRLAAERIRRGVQALALPHIASGTTSVVTVSVGVAMGDARGDPGLKHLIRQADEALYAAKAQGRNRVAIHGERESLLALAG